MSLNEKIKKITEKVILSCVEECEKDDETNSVSVFLTVFEVSFLKSLESAVQEKLSAERIIDGFIVRLEKLKKDLKG